MPKPPFTFGRRVFHDYAFEGPKTVTLYVNEPADIAWAVSNLGQYVEVDRAGAAFGLGTAYVYSVTNPRHSRGSFTVIIEWSR